MAAAFSDTVYTITAGGRFSILRTGNSPPDYILCAYIAIMNMHACMHALYEHACMHVTCMHQLNLINRKHYAEIGPNYDIVYDYLAI